MAPRHSAQQAGPAGFLGANRSSLQRTEIAQGGRRTPATRTGLANYCFQEIAGRSKAIIERLNLHVTRTGRNKTHLVRYYKAHTASPKP